MKTLKSLIDPSKKLLITVDLKAIEVFFMRLYGEPLVDILLLCPYLTYRGKCQSS